MPVPLLPKAWEQPAARLRSAPGIALFVDFDGTLSPLVSDPAAARIDRATRGALARLSRNPRARVCVISGRRHDDLRARIALPSLRYLGVHGADTGSASAFAPEVQQRIAEAHRELSARLNGAAGVHVAAGVHLEDKGLSFALHYRGARPAAMVRAANLLGQILARSEGRLQLLHGDSVWEVLPSEILGKSHAARKQWKAWGLDTVPVYIGNDSTDEGAFHALASGITVRVGPARASKAHYSLRNTAEVRWFLIQLEKELQCRTPPDSNS